MFASRTKLVDHLVRQNSSGCKCGIYLVRYYLIKNGNRTEWSPIQSVILQVIIKESILLIIRMIIDRIGW